MPDFIKKEVNQMLDKNIAIITPNITESNNLRLTYNQNEKSSVETSIVCYDSDKYIIMNKNGNAPDITLDESIVDLLLKARETKTIMTMVIDYLAKNQNYNNNIINDKRVLSAILNDINTTQKPSSDAIEAIVRGCIEAQKYKI